MVTKIISGHSIRGLLNYNENKVEEGMATLILANRFATDIDKLDFRAKLNRFENLTETNSRVKTNAMHLMLNFDREDKINTATMQRIASDYMDKIGLGEQPYLVYLHKDVSHQHLHIVTTNMQADGKRIPIHNIGKTLSETARKELEVQYGLVKADGNYAPFVINYWTSAIASRCLIGYNQQFTRKIILYNTIYLTFMSELVSVLSKRYTWVTYRYNIVKNFTFRINN